MFSTPDTSHLSSADFEHVYEPAEDSFLMLDALEKEYSTLLNLRPSVCLEIGCGSGVCITFLAQMLGPQALYLCTDINPRAVSATKKTAQKNGVSLEPVLTNLVDSLEVRLKNKIDVLLFNPPYVVTPSEEVGSRGLEAAWAGGERGREVMDKVFPKVSSLLSASGVFYLVIVKDNNQDEIEDILRQQGLQMQVVISRRSGNESLSILKFVKGDAT